MEANPFLLLFFLKIMTLLIVCGIIFIVLFVFIMISTSAPINRCEMAWHVDRSAVNFVLNVCALLAYPHSTHPSQKDFIFLFLVHSSILRLCAMILQFFELQCQYYLNYSILCVLQSVLVM